jgi:hypothetical protein
MIFSDLPPPAEASNESGDRFAWLRTGRKPVSTFHDALSIISNNCLHVRLRHKADILIGLANGCSRGNSEHLGTRSNVVGNGLLGVYNAVSAAITPAL